MALPHRQASTGVGLLQLRRQHPRGHPQGARTWDAQRGPRGTDGGSHGRPDGAVVRGRRPRGQG